MRKDNGSVLSSEERHATSPTERMECVPINEEAMMILKRATLAAVLFAAAGAAGGDGNIDGYRALDALRADIAEFDALSRPDRRALLDKMDALSDAELNVLFAGLTDAEREAIDATLDRDQAELRRLGRLLEPRITDFERLAVAAEQGDADAQFSFAVMYRKGIGVPRDDAEAVRWLHKAAVQGHYLAQYGLGELYANGEGVPRDLVLAYAWLNLAASSHDSPFTESHRESRDRIARQMEHSEIAEAQRKSREFAAAVEQSRVSD